MQSGEPSSLLLHSIANAFKLTTLMAEGLLCTVSHCKTGAMQADKLVWLAKVCE